jgi:aryl-alcohol dehydrogenase-like predicted oxidoreductase
MEYRKLGNSGLDVSAVGLGTNNFGGYMNFDATDEVIRKAVDVGINMIDTANTYGDSMSEEFIGKSTKGFRDKVVLATKVGSSRGDGPNQGGASRQHIIEQVEGSLRRLRTDYIDLYQLHLPDPATPIDETLRALDDLVHQGKVRYVGCSNFASWQVAQAMEQAATLGLEPFISVQPHYNILRRDVEAELLPCCEAYALGILPYFPLANGFLTGKYRRGQAPPQGTRLAGNPASAERYLTEANFDVLERLEAFAVERGHTMVDLAIAWLLATPRVGSVIAGATRTEQVEANAGAADWRLTSDDKKELDGILGGGA